MEPAFVGRLVLIRFRGAEFSERGYVGSGRVQRDGAHRDGRICSGHFHRPQMRRTGAPAVAEDGLVVAVEDRHVGRGGVESEDAGAGIEARVDVFAQAETGFVPAGCEDPPFLGVGRGRGGGDAIEDCAAPVFKGEGVDLGSAEFGCCGWWAVRESIFYMCM